MGLSSLYRFLISFIDTRSSNLIFNIARRQLFSNTFNFLVSYLVKDQVSEAYIAIGRINTSYDCSFNFVGVSLRDYTLFFSLPKAELVVAILLFTSSDEFGTTGPRNLNSSTFSTFSFSIVMLA